jgi:site-specific DNA-methyltransferase (adenine-specific)
VGPKPGEGPSRYHAKLSFTFYPLYRDRLSGRLGRDKQAIGFSAMWLESGHTHRRATQEATPTFWTFGKQTVAVGDCLTGLGLLPDKSIDVCVTSPPYNIGVAYRTHHDRMPKDDYLAWMGTVAHQIARVLRDDGSLFLNVGQTNVDPWIAYEVAGQFRQLFVLQNNISWVKSVSIGDDTFGHFKPINSKRFLNNNFESLFHFTKSANVEVDRLAIGVPFKDKTNIERWGHTRDRRCAGNVWFIPYNTVRSKTEKFDHPAGYPIELPKRCIRMHGRENAKILDPFLGAGTTLVAAEQLGMSGIGFEIDPSYAETAAARLKAEVDAT